MNIFDPYLELYLEPYLEYIIRKDDGSHGWIATTDNYYYEHESDKDQDTFRYTFK